MANTRAGVNAWNPYIPSDPSARANRVSLLNYKENKEKGKHNTTPLIWVHGWFTAWSSCIRGFFDSVLQMFAPTLSHRGSIIILHPWFGGKDYDHFRFLGKGSRLRWGSLVLLGRDIWPIKGKKFPEISIFFCSGRTFRKCFLTVVCALKNNVSNSHATFSFLSSLSRSHYTGLSPDTLFKELEWGKKSLSSFPYFLSNQISSQTHAHKSRLLLIIYLLGSSVTSEYTQQVLYTGNMYIYTHVYMWFSSSYLPIYSYVVSVQPTTWDVDPYALSPFSLGQYH